MRENRTEKGGGGDSEKADVFAGGLGSSGPIYSSGLYLAPKKALCTQHSKDSINIWGMNSPSIKAEN